MGGGARLSRHAARDSGSIPDSGCARNFPTVKWLPAGSEVLGREKKTMTKITDVTRRTALGLLAATGLVAALAGPAAAQDPLKVAGIWTVPIEQQWVSRLHNALQAAEDRGEITYDYSENVSNTDYERVMREYAEQGMQ